MTKTICDVCGKEMPTTKSVDIIGNLNFCISSYGRMWDVCDGCRVSLNRWMTIRKQGCDEKECSYKAGSEEE